MNSQQQRTSVNSLLTTTVPPMMPALPPRQPISPPLFSGQTVEPFKGGGETSSSSSFSIKILYAAILSVFAMITFSSMAYSFTDHIASGFNLDLFSTEGEPSIMAVTIHTIVYMVVIIIALSIYKN